MAQYNKYNAYDFERFEPKTVSSSSAAPKIKQAPQPKPQIRLVEKPRLSAAQLRAQSHAAGFKAAKIFIVAVIVLAFMAGVIYSRVQLDEINRDINRVEDSIKNAKSDSVRLNMALNSEISIDKVNDFAVNTLGMVKVQDYQVVYIDLSTEDKVVKSEGAKTSGDTVINETTK